MNDESFETLLRRAKRDITTPLLDRDLAARARLRWRRRRRYRVMTAAAGVMVMFVLVTSSTVFILNRPMVSPGSPIASVPDGHSTPTLPDDALSAKHVRRLRDELAAFEQEVRRHQARVTEGTVSLMQPSELLASRPVTEPFEMARLEFEKTAYLLVDRAERKLLAERPDTARQLYLDVVRHFPDTLAGKAARSHLEQLPKQKGNL